LSQPVTSAELQSWLLRGVSFDFAPFQPDVPVPERQGLRVIAS
jgi:hypothetical protein